MKGTIGIALSFFIGFGLVLGCDPVTAFAQAVFPVVESLQHGWGYLILAIPIVGLVALFLQASKEGLVYLVLVAAAFIGGMIFAYHASA